ncbi:heptosyltransferase-3 [Thermodesulfobium acidiphilum]|uniref:Heptosyltransferase-3 n=1 Tax=Thermodesulfobium acidiphilum TaxID=1794699 RepID=A0A2R4W0M5_THEAF|nr:glycosyltransferase family 9 protein [Thermodesulfobium acidiphilum]AWB10359.1 heptosyltransferase-3 [Thermodesulfobium acidiphilum]
MSKRILIISARNFGDAIISTSLINSFGSNFSDYKIDLLTRYDFKEIFENNPYVNNIYFANFPMGTNKNFNCKELFKLIKIINLLSKNKYDFILNNIGDIRENLLGKMMKPKLNISIKFEKSHPFRNLIRLNNCLFTDKCISIPVEVKNIYDIQDFISSKLGCTKVLPPKIYIKAKNEKSPKIIGIHPMASQDCKLWDFHKWEKLINILKRAYTIWIFGSNNELSLLNKVFKAAVDEKRVFIKTTTLNEFFINLSKCSLLIGLDSFSIHASSALGVKSIMISGGNDWEIWKPKNCYVISKGSSVCKFYPCFNKPKCLNTSDEYICMKSIEVDEVLGLINKILC